MTLLDDGSARAESQLTPTEQLIEVAPVVRRICVSRLGLWDGEDAAQEVLERACRAQHRDVDPIGSLYGYALVSARWHGLRGNHGGRSRTAGTPIGDIAAQQWPDPAAGPEDRFLRGEEIREAANRVGGLLAGLTAREREVLAASTLAGRSTKQAAALLGITPSSVRTVQVRAMARLREAVGVSSPNPLASKVPAAERSRQAAAARAARRGVVPKDRRRLPPGVAEAGRQAAATGSSTAELMRTFDVSESTAWRWRRAMAATRDSAPPAGAEPVMPSGRPAPLAAASSGDDGIDATQTAVADARRAVTQALADHAGDAIQDATRPDLPRQPDREHRPNLTVSLPDHDEAPHHVEHVVMAHADDSADGA